MLKTNEQIKERIQIFFAGLFIGIVCVSIIFIFFQPTPKTPIIEIPDKMKECIEQGGQFFLRDWSLGGDNSEYKTRCVSPEIELFFMDFKFPL